MAAYQPSRLDEYVRVSRQALALICNQIEQLDRIEQDRKWADLAMVRCPRCDGSCVDPSAKQHLGLPYDFPCQECEGEGAVPADGTDVVCSRCSGTGTTSRSDDHGPQVVCSACGGSGSASHPRRRRSA